MTEPTISRQVANQTYGKAYRIGRGSCGSLWIAPFYKGMRVVKRTLNGVPADATLCPCGCGPLYLTTWGRSRARVLP